MPRCLLIFTLIEHAAKLRAVGRLTRHRLQRRPRTLTISTLVFGRPVPPFIKTVLKVAEFGVHQRTVLVAAEQVTVQTLVVGDGVGHAKCVARLHAILRMAHGLWTGEAVLLH